MSSEAGITHKCDCSIWQALQIFLDNARSQTRLGGSFRMREKVIHVIKKSTKQYSNAATAAKG